MIMQFFCHDKEIKGNERKISFFLACGRSMAWIFRQIFLVVKPKTDFRCLLDGGFVCSTILLFG